MTSLIFEIYGSTTGLGTVGAASCSVFPRLPVIPFSRIHLTWASYFSAREESNSSAGLARVVAKVSTGALRGGFWRRKNMNVLFL